MKKDLYGILDLPREAKTKQIERAYLKLARRFHPDVNPGIQSAAARFREIQEAYRVLSNRNSRELYDREGKVEVPAREDVRFPKGKSRHPDSRGWESIVRDIFHEESEGESETEPGRGEDIHQVLEISFLDSLRGAKKKIVYQREVVCRSCGGGRFAPDAEIHACPDCSGIGLEAARRGPYTVKKICRRCSGTGEVSDELCRNCAGKGRVLVTEKKTVAVPAGSDSGTQVVLAGAGQTGKRGGPPGNVVVTVRVEAHSVLERRGYNLYCTVPVSVTEAALGATMLVPTVERKVSLRIPAGTQSEQEFQLEGKGVVRPDGKRGNLCVRVRVIVPQAVDGRARQLFRELEKLFPGNPRVKA